MNEDEAYGLKTIGFHTTTSGRKYEVQYSPDGKLAQAVHLPHGGGAGHLVLAFRAESKEEALKMLVEELDSGSH